MVPRGDIIAFDVDRYFQALTEAFSEAGHSRLPVFRGSLAEIVGMIHVKDVYSKIVDEVRSPIVEPYPLPPPALFVPPAMRVPEIGRPTCRARGGQYA